MAWDPSSSGFSAGFEPRGRLSRWGSVEPLARRDFSSRSVTSGVVQASVTCDPRQCWVRRVRSLTLTSGRGGAGERGRGPRQCWDRQRWVRAAASPAGAAQASAATEAVLGSSRSATCRVGAGERGKGGSAGFEPRPHLDLGLRGPRLLCDPWPVVFWRDVALVVTVAAGVRTPQFPSMAAPHASTAPLTPARRLRVRVYLPPQRVI